MTRSEDHAVDRPSPGGVRAGQGRGLVRGDASAARTLDGRVAAAGYNHGTGIDFTRLRAVISINAVLEHYGHQQRMRRHGRRSIGPCPIHRGSNARAFIVDPVSNTFFCFGDCDRGGGTLELVSLIEEISLTAAAERLAHWFSFVPPPSPHPRRATMSNKPTHAVCVPVELKPDGDGQVKTIYRRIGSAWPIKNGGLSVILDAHPIGARLVLFTEDGDTPLMRAKAE